ncbi:hypothetical protein V6N13_044650 [Hibiscus sabdariffa]
MMEVLRMEVYSDNMVSDEQSIVRIPENLPLDAAAPLLCLCTGITVYSPLRYYGLDQPGLHMGMVGLGGLGHVAVKFAKAMGVKALLKRSFCGKLDGIIDTVSAEHPLLPLIGLLKSNGKLVLVWALKKPLEIPIFPLLQGKNLLLRNAFSKADAKYSFVIALGTLRRQLLEVFAHFRYQTNKQNTSPNIIML